MKTIVNTLLALGFITVSYSQEISKSELNEENSKEINLPEVVIKSVGKDFSVYIRDKNVDPKVAELQNEFIEYSLGENYKEYDSYRVLFELNSGDGKLYATYDENGKLTKVTESYKNLKIPTHIRHSIYKAYPGWQIINDKYFYSQENGKNLKKEYTFKLKKDSKKMRLIMDSNGQIVANK